MTESQPKQAITPTSNVVDGAVGMEKIHWYVALVNHNSEKIISSRLADIGYDTYVATQSEMRVWRNGRRTKVDRVVIPCSVFVRCTERQRLVIVKEPYVNRFLVNRASGGNLYGKSVAIIPDSQMAMLRFMLGASRMPVEFENRVYASGERVRVVRGELRGLEGEVLQASDGKSQLLVRLDILGCAKVTIDPLFLAPVSNS